MRFSGMLRAAVTMTAVVAMLSGTAMAENWTRLRLGIDPTESARGLGPP